MNRLFRRAPPQPWPMPQDSLGQKINTRTKRMKGSSAWFARGPAQEHYNSSIRPDIESILRNVDLPEGAPLFLHLYMIGKREDKANPIVMVCCVNRDIRKKAEASIRESSILHRFPGFGLGSSALPLEAGHIPRPFVSVEEMEDGKSSDFPGSCKRQRDRSDGLKDLQDSGGKDNATKKLKMASTADSKSVQSRHAMRLRSSRVTSQPSRSKVGIGCPLTFRFSSPASRVQHSTGGPIIKVGNDLYQLTVAHSAQFNNKGDNHEQASDLDDCEFDGQSDEDDDDQPFTSRGSLSPETSSKRYDGIARDQGDTSSSEIDTPGTSSLYSSHSPRTTTVTGSSARNTPQKSRLFTRSTIRHRLKKDQPTLPIEIPTVKTAAVISSISANGLDYWLEKTTVEELTVASNFVTVDAKGNRSSLHVTDIASITRLPTTIFAATRRGPISGNISGWTSVKTRASSGFQRMLTVSLSQILVPGDSGSAIIDVNSGKYYGHVVFGVEGHTVAYVVPAPDVFADIAVRFGHSPTLWKGLGNGGSPSQALGGKQSSRAREAVSSKVAHNRVTSAPEDTSAAKVEGEPSRALRRSARLKLPKQGPKTIRPMIPISEEVSEASSASNVASLPVLNLPAKPKRPSRSQALKATSPVSKRLKHKSGTPLYYMWTCVSCY